MLCNIKAWFLLLHKHKHKHKHNGSSYVLGYACVLGVLTAIMLRLVFVLMS